MERKALETNNNLVFEIDTAPDTDTPVWASLGAFLTSTSESLNEQTQQFFFFDDKGFATNAVTGMAPQFTCNGQRVHGDTACDYLYGLRYKIGVDRETQIRMSRTVGAATSTVTCAVTVLNLTCEDGESNGAVPMNVTFAMNGKPVVGSTPFTE